MEVSMSSSLFISRLQQQPVLCDGAMGTLLYSKGIFINRSYDELNVSQPELIRGIHQEYLHNGAEVIETNTFGANSFRLARHGFADKTREINLAGARVAKEAAKSFAAWVAGAVGPLGVRIEPLGKIAREEARESFRQQIEALVEGGVDLLVLETFGSVDELHQAILAAREVNAAIPVVAEVTIDEEGNALDGSTPETFGPRLEEFGADVIGINCSVGPVAMLEAIERVRPLVKAPLSAMPNAGMPRSVEGRNIYLCSPEYMASYARKSVGIDGMNIPDSPRASARMSNQALCLLTQQQAGIETLLHYTCRDRNVLGIQSDLLGAYAIGIRNLICITGDPPKMGNYPDATAVFDVDAIGLVNIVHNLNRGLDIGGNTIGTATSFVIGVGANPGAANLDEEVRRFEYKVEAGAEYAVTQPVFDLRLLETFLRRIEHCRIPVIAGIWPLVSLRNAEFMKNELRVSVPDSILERMGRAATPDAARAEGVAIAREMLTALRDMVQGAQISAPMGRYSSAVDVLEALGSAASARPAARR